MNVIQTVSKSTRLQSQLGDKQHSLNGGTLAQLVWRVNDKIIKMKKVDTSKYITALPEFLPLLPYHVIQGECSLHSASHSPYSDTMQLYPVSIDSTIYNLYGNDSLTPGSPGEHTSYSWRQESYTHTESYIYIHSSSSN